jgi:hypothetical protein
MDIEINGIQYRSNNKINAIDQYLIAKRLVPILDVLQKVSRVRPEDEEAPDPILSLAEGVSKLSDEDSMFIFNKTLTGVQSKRGDHWALIWNPQAKQLQFDDIDMTVMLRLTFEILSETMGSFLGSQAVTLPSTRLPQNGR